MRPRRRRQGAVPALVLGLCLGVVALGAHSFSSAGYHAHLSDVAPEASGKISVGDVLLGVNGTAVTKLKDVVEYYNSGTEEGYRKFIPSRRKKREGRIII